MPTEITKWPTLRLILAIFAGAAGMWLWSSTAPGTGLDSSLLSLGLDQQRASIVVGVAGAVVASTAASLIASTPPVWPWAIGTLGDLAPEVTAFGGDQAALITNNPLREVLGSKPSLRGRVLCRLGFKRRAQEREQAVCPAAACTGLRGCNQRGSRCAHLGRVEAAATHCP